MTARVITGSKEQIARQVAEMEGDVREAIVFVEEPLGTPPGTQVVPESVEEMFREMAPYESHAAEVDDSREAIYTRKPGE